MLVETTQQGIRLVPRRSFAGLMTLYETNYLRLGRILADHRDPPGRALSRVPGDLDLHLETLERCRYTTTLRLTYWFDDGRSVRPDPDLIVRLYHDARLAEVTSCCEYHAHRILRPWYTPGGEEIRERWARNQMFHKWLEFCIDRGHRLIDSREVTCTDSS